MTVVIPSVFQFPCKGVDPVLHHMHTPQERPGLVWVNLRSASRFSNRIIKERLNDHVLRDASILEALTRRIDRAISEAPVLSWKNVREGSVVVRIRHALSISNSATEMQISPEHWSFKMSDDDGFRPDLNGLAKRRFSQSARTKDFQSRDARLNANQIGNIERRAAQVREKAREHFRKMKPVWVDGERARLSRNNPERLSSSRSDGPKPPTFENNRTDSRRTAIAAQAEANVKSRCDERIRRIEKIEHRMVRSVQRNRKNKR